MNNINDSKTLDTTNFSIKKDIYKVASTIIDNAAFLVVDHEKDILTNFYKCNHCRQSAIVGAPIDHEADCVVKAAERILTKFKIKAKKQIEKRNIESRERLNNHMAVERMKGFAVKNMFQRAYDNANKNKNN